MKKGKIIFISVLLIIFLYVSISWLLLDGRIIYTTSFNESNISTSKKENLFVTDKLEIISEGDSVMNWENNIEIWTNKYFEVKYFGILLYWTSIKSEWRYLNIGFKNEFYPYLNDWCYKENNEKGLKGCCDRIACNVGDTIKIDFYKCKEELKIGTLKIVVK